MPGLWFFMPEPALIKPVVAISAGLPGQLWINFPVEAMGVSKCHWNFDSKEDDYD